ncbi:MAG: ATP-binding cassette domain-containing protein, partial [Candidatus Izemoplasmataceae bacterium]
MLRLSGVWRTYQTGDIKTHALRGVDLEVKEGEFLVILGPSGSGKSTMLNIMGGLDHPTEGTVSVGSRV